MLCSVSHHNKEQKQAHFTAIIW